MQANVVVAEASKTVRRMVEIALEKHPLALHPTEDASGALAMAREVGAEVVIADANLPGDGYEAVRQLKSDAATKAVKAILLVGRNHQYDAARGRKAGVDAHLTKPFTTQQLVELVFKQLGQPVPDTDLFKSGLSIPLARQPKVETPAPEPPAPAPAPAVAAPKPPAPPPPPAAKSNPFDGVSSPFDGNEPTRQFQKPEENPALAPEAQKAPSEPPPAVAAAAVERVAAAASGGDLGAALQGASREVVERIAWEVIPALAEAILKEEIARVVRERMSH